MSKKLKKIQLNERDVKILQSLWKWKAATTASVAGEFYGSPFCDSAYRRLKNLLKLDYVAQRPIKDNYEEYVWILSDNGFRLLENDLPSLSEMGYKSEALEHDYYCTALQRGPWLESIPESVEFFSEQELRRYRIDHYPSWVPKSRSHRSDGYSRIPIKGELRTISFEVELNRKPPSKYSVTAKFYEDCESVSRVVWVVRNLALAKSIQNIFKEASPSKYLIHDFIIFEDFKKLGWLSTIVLGHEHGKTLSQLLEHDITLKCFSRDTQHLLNPQRRPYISKRYAEVRKSSVCNRPSPGLVANGAVHAPNRKTLMDAVSEQTKLKRKSTWE